MAIDEWFQWNAGNSNNSVRMQLTQLLMNFVNDVDELWTQLTDGMLNLDDAIRHSRKKRV